MSTITLKVKILPNNFQTSLLTNTTIEYVRAVNSVVADFEREGKELKYSSKDVVADLPSSLKAQVTLDAKSVYKKYKKGITKSLAILRKPVAVWNNQNWKFSNNSLSFPVWLNNKSQRITVKALFTEYILDKLENSKLGTLRITKVNGKWVAQISITIKDDKNESTGVMGVDLGLKVPAVAYTEQAKIQFFGNGRKNKYIKRKFRAKRRELGLAKKPKAIVTLNKKEQRIMKDIDHKISREIVNFAIDNKIGTIKLERLENIRKSTRKSRKNEKNLHTWSFYRLAQFIEYKARLSGIDVVYVNPAYTSQVCPSCGEKNHATDRKYKCTCGFHHHRDIVGAINIMNVPVIDGNSLSA